MPSAHNLYAIEINFLFFLIFFHTLLASLKLKSTVMRRGTRRSSCCCRSTGVGCNQDGYCRCDQGKVRKTGWSSHFVNTGVLHMAHPDPRNPDPQLKTAGSA